MRKENTHVRRIAILPTCTTLSYTTKKYTHTYIHVHYDIHHIEKLITKSNNNDLYIFFILYFLSFT